MTMAQSKHASLSRTKVTFKTFLCWYIATLYIQVLLINVVGLDMSFTVQGMYVSVISYLLILNHKIDTVYPFGHLCKLKQCARTWF